METRKHSSALEESAIIERVARIVSSVRGAKPDYTRLAAELEQAVPFDIFGVVLLRHDRQAVRITVCRREVDTWVASYHQHPLKDSMLERVLQSPTLRVNNYPNGLDGSPVVSGDALSGYHQLHSTLIAPLTIEDRVLGALELGSIAVNMYADTTLQRLVSAVVRVLAAAIEGAQVGGRAEIQDRQRQALKDVSSALASKMDLSTILNQIVVGVASALNGASAMILLNRSEGKLRLEAQSGSDHAALCRVLSRCHWRISEKCIIGQTILRRQPYVSHDIASDKRFPESAAFATELGIHSILSYPLVAGTTVYGAILLSSPDTGGFTPLKADILSLFADQATLAIHNGILLDAAHQRNRFQEAVERLERLHLQHVVSHESAKRSDDLEAGLQQEEYELFASVCAQTQRTFGVSFASLLHFISNHLLTTQSERDLCTLLHVGQDEQTNERAVSVASSVQEQDREGPFADTLSLLAQTAEAALARAGMLGELSRLLMQLKQSTDGVKDAWFVVNLNGTCMYMNPSAEAFCGVCLEEMTSCHTRFLSLVQKQEALIKIEDVFEKPLRYMRNADEVQTYLLNFTQESTYRRELRCILAAEPVDTSLHSDIGERNSLLLESAPTDYHYQFIRYPLSNQQGQIEANALQVRDVTEQVRDEKNRSALLSSVSHDLRTPLTTIKAAVTGLLQTDVKWEEQDRRAMLEDIDSETDHLTVLVGALVEMSRIEMGALILEKEWCDVVEVVYGALAKLKRVQAGRFVRIDVSQHLPLIYVDHAQLERVFYNLIENAIRHSPEQTEVVVTLDIVKSLSEVIRIRVVDRGSGIPEHERERIFKSFYSLRTYGNGLGLAICKGIIDAHQGHIWVDAVDGGGSCFNFTLPTQPHSVVHVGGDAISSASWRVLDEDATLSQQIQTIAGEELL